jgi:hypothetical protein
MSTLRKALIKLAHEKPELRKHLVPLLKQAGNAFRVGQRVRFKDKFHRIFEGEVLTIEGTDYAIWLDRKSQKPGQPQLVHGIHEDQMVALSF